MQKKKIFFPGTPPVPGGKVFYLKSSKYCISGVSCPILMIWESKWGFLRPRNGLVIVSRALHVSYMCQARVTCFYFLIVICCLSWSLTLWKFSMSCNKVVDFNLKGHRVFINSSVEKYNLFLLPKGERGSMNNFLCSYSSFPIQVRWEGGKWEWANVSFWAIFFLKAFLSPK